MLHALLLLFLAAQDASGLSCVYAVLAIESGISQARPNAFTGE